MPESGDGTDPGQTPELPLDSDTDVEEHPGSAPRPPRVHPADVALVTVGGAVGVAARSVLTRVTAPALSGPAIMMMINIAGCVVLGVLLEFLALRGTDHGHRRTIRLMVGTGTLGGFTSYSTFTVGIHGLLQSGQVAGGIGYGVGSVVAGVLAAALGVAVASRLQPTPRRPRP